MIWAQRNTIIRHQSHQSDWRKLLGFSHTGSFSKRNPYLSCVYLKENIFLYFLTKDTKERFICPVFINIDPKESIIWYWCFGFSALVVHFKAFKGWSKLMFSSSSDTDPSKMRETQHRPTRCRCLWWRCQSCLRSYHTWISSGSEWVAGMWCWWWWPRW